MPKHTPEQQAAKAKLSADKFRVRKLLVAGDSKGARAYADEVGINVFDARLAAVYKNEAEPFFLALETELGIAPQGPPAFITPKGEVILPEPDEAPTTVAVEVAQEPAPVEPIPTAPTPPPVVELVNGWPRNASATVWGFPPNQKLMVVQLADGRKASCWRAWRKWRIYDKLNVRLTYSETADPIYEWVPGAWQ